MRADILQNGQILRQIAHNGQTYLEVPVTGDYQIQLYNNSPVRKLVVLSVDGLDVIDGKPASHASPGYCIGAYQRAVIKGWRRSDSEVANFQFTGEDGSYTAQVGKGVRNAGVIGIAVFDEKIKQPPVIINPIIVNPWPVVQPVHIWHNGDTIRSNSGGVTYSQETSKGVDLNSSQVYCSTADSNTLGEGPIVAACAAAAPACAMDDGLGMSELSSGERSVLRGATKSASRGRGSPKKQPQGVSTQSLGAAPASSPAPSLGTGYGGRAEMHTSTTEFVRATEHPYLVVQIRYGLREKLIEWGVPAWLLGSGSTEKMPEAFPAQPQMSVQAPPGWRG